MKLLLAFVGVAFSFGVITAVQAEAQIKEVCKEIIGKDGKPMKDAKGKPVEKCTKIKVHKKVEGEKVPDNKKK